MILPYSTQFTCPVKENGFSSSSSFWGSSNCKRNRFEVTSSRYQCFGSVKIAFSKGKVTRSRRNVKAFGLVDKLGKKVWREKEDDGSDSEDEEGEVKKETSGKRAGDEASLDDPEERREWRKTIREVIDKHPDIEEDEEIDLLEKRRKMQKLLADYPLVVNEEDPDWPEDADGWGFSFNQFFNKITIKNEKKKDDDDDDDNGGDDKEKEIVWQDDNYIRPIKDLTTAEWEEAVFKDISPLMVLVHNRYKRSVVNSSFYCQTPSVSGLVDCLIDIAKIS